MTGRVGYTGGMRAVIASLFAVWVPLALQLPAAASPPDDIAAYCRSIHPQVASQVKCVNMENTAAARVRSIGPGADPEGWSRCRETTPSWSAMEQCLANAARAAAGGDAAKRPGATEEPPASSPGAPPSSTVILGPQPTAAPPGERDRPTRHISEEDADRQLRAVLERNPSARCTKKQYGPGWVITCE